MAEQDSARPLADSSAEHSRAHLRAEFKLALAVLVIFTGCKIFFEHTHFGHWLHVQSRLWLQSHLHPADEPPAVAVVDITSLKREPFFVTNGTEVAREYFTPRRDLERLLEKIAEANPAAIGVDIDLSVETNLVLETALLEQCVAFKDRALEISKTIPVRLGVKRNEALSPDDWLGEKYRVLAASLARPVGLVTHMPMAIEFPDHRVTLNGLASALAQSASSSKSSWLLNIFARRVVTNTPVENLSTFKILKFPVDYAPLKQLMAEKLSSETLLNQSGDFSGKFRNKIVLLGDAADTGGSDTAIVPGHDEPVPGVFVHACAAYTLLRAPLWELKSIYGLLLAFLCSLASVFVIFRTCARFTSRHRVTTVPLTILLTLTLMAGFIFAAIGLAIWFHVLWLEVLLVCLVLVAECLFEILFGSVRWKKIHQKPVESLVVAED